MSRNFFLLLNVFIISGFHVSYDSNVYFRVNLAVIDFLFFIPKKQLPKSPSVIHLVMYFNSRAFKVPNAPTALSNVL